jgi:RHS repeat-associated protein
VEGGGLEETLQYLNRNRYYDPQIGRFISEDPVGILLLESNLFAYVLNNPQNWVDPYGLQPGTKALLDLTQMIMNIANAKKPKEEAAKVNREARARYLEQQRQKALEEETRKTEEWLNKIRTDNELEDLGPIPREEGGIEEFDYCQF